MKKVLLFGLVIALAACGGKRQDGSSKITLSGAGATFPQPYYDAAFKSYQDSTGTVVTYGGVGSGGGIRSLKDQIVDFGASDAFLSDKDMEKMPSQVVHIPTCMGAVVLAYNLPEVKDLKLTGELVADIYLGKISKWNDKRIAEINPGLQLPNSTINPVYRSDGSGTTFVFSDYLSKVSPEFSEKVGRDKALKWPVGIAGKGNPGVAGTISQTAGAIGYIGSEYSFAQNLPVAELKNKAGNFILPSTESISAAAAGELPADTRAMITNSDHPNAYPIACFTWIVIYKEQNYNKRGLKQAEATLKLLDWMTNAQAQGLTAKIHYSPLPESAVKNAKTILKSVTYDGQAILK